MLIHLLAALQGVALIAIAGFAVVLALYRPDRERGWQLGAVFAAVLLVAVSEIARSEARSEIRNKWKIFAPF